jgi:phage tail sheath protein FI
MWNARRWDKPPRTNPGTGRDNSWNHVNIRRPFVFLEQSIDKGTQWVVFEPNSQHLWARMAQAISNFLTTLWPVRRIPSPDV